MWGGGARVWGRRYGVGRRSEGCGEELHVGVSGSTEAQVCRK